MLPAGNLLILSETKGSPASVGPAAMMLTRENMTVIKLGFIDVGRFERDGKTISPRQDFDGVQILSNVKILHRMLKKVVQQGRSE
jgi:hypothetical protein